jgi:hypothetical protein
MDHLLLLIVTCQNYLDGELLRIRGCSEKFSA